MENGKKRLYLFPSFENEPEKKEKEPPKLELLRPSFIPCAMGSRFGINVINRGGESKGIALEFIGDYIENDGLNRRRLSACNYKVMFGKGLLLPRSHHPRLSGSFGSLSRYSG